MGTETSTNEKSNKMLKVLDWAYEKSLNGLPGMGTAIELANDYSKKEGMPSEQVNSLIRWQITKTSAAGFLAGLGGVIVLPVTLPADIGSTIYVQIRMIAAIAHMGGYDVKDDRVKSLVFACLIGESVKDILKSAGIQFGVKLSKSLISKIPGKVLTKINQKVAFRLVTKFGERGVVNLVKLVPFFGGVIGGSINGVATNTIGNISRKTFLEKEDGKVIADDFIDAVTVDDVPNVELLKFYSYLNLIKVDGQRRNEEYEFIDSAINSSLLSDTLKMELIQKLNSDDIDEVDYSLFKENKDLSSDFLNNLINLAKCDKEFHPSEKMFIKNVAKQLGYDTSEIIKMIE